MALTYLRNQPSGGIAPPGQEGWREAPGWLLKTLFWNNHPVCAGSVADAAFS